MSELREALTVATTQPLINKIIDPLLLEYQRRYSPLVRSIPSFNWDVDIYNFNQRTQVASGGFVTDGGAQPVANSTYAQNSFQMKHLQVVGAVTGYTQKITAGVIGDLRREEIEGSVQGMTWDIENATVWGNAASTVGGARPQFDGLDSQVATFSGGAQNAIDKAGATLSLANLDQLIDMVESNAAMSVFDTSWMFVLSSTAISKIQQLMVSQQRFMGQVEVAAGLIVDTYRNIPLVKSSFLAARTYSVGTVTSATATTGGTLAAATYSYKIAAVMARQGEIACSAEVSQATTGTTSTVTLSFTPPTGLEGSQPTLFKVYRSTASGTETFLGYVDATVGLSADGVTPVVTTSIVDNGAALVPMNGATAPAIPTPVYVGTNTGMLPPGTGQENLFLIARDKKFVCRPRVREFEPLDVFPTVTSPDTLPYALVTDTCLAVRASKYTGRLARVAVSV